MRVNFHTFEDTTVHDFLLKGRKAEVTHYKFFSKVFNPKSTQKKRND